MGLRSVQLALCVAILGCGPAVEFDGELQNRTEQPIAAPLNEPPPRPDPNNPDCPAPTLIDLHTAIFSPTCAASECHVGAEAPEGLDFSIEPDALRARLEQPATQSPSGIPLITPGQPASSYLYLKVFLKTPLIGEQMPPTEPLVECEVDAIRTWIEQGATD